MPKLLLIDADSKIPNLALMKLSAFYKKKDWDIELRRLNIPYFPSRKKKNHYIISYRYNKILCSVVFNGTKQYIKGKNIEFGGSGYSINKKLEEEIELQEPDYSIYPECDTSYGFISRGCIRNCSFCIVPKKEGKIKQVSTIEKIVKHNRVKFLDNNFLALPNHLDLLLELIDRNIKVQFNQGLDIRLINKNNSLLLSKLNYLGEYTFAFDNYRLLSVIEQKLKLMAWRKNKSFRFFVYIHPNMKIEEIVNRVIFLRNNNCLVYAMRDISCWNSINKRFYDDIASWCNQPGLFKKLSFKEFMEKRYNDSNRISFCLDLYKQ